LPTRFIFVVNPAVDVEFLSALENGSGHSSANTLFNLNIVFCNWKKLVKRASNNVSTKAIRQTGPADLPDNVREKI
jgi:hypothetical protein